MTRYILKEPVASLVEFASFQHVGAVGIEPTTKWL